MTVIEKIKNYPLVLWALGFYLVSLGFDLRLDIPLAVFAMVSIYALMSSPHEDDFKQVMQQHWPLLVFLVVTALATLCSKDIGHSLGVQVQFLPALLIYIVIVRFANEKRLLDFVFIALILAALIAGAVLFIRLVLNELSDPMEKIVSLRSSLFTVPNDALFLSVLVPVALAIALADSHKYIKVLAAVYLIMTFVIAVYLQSRQTVAVFIFSICVLAFLHKPQYGFWAGLILLVIALLFDSLLGKGLVNKLVLFFPRQYVWGAAWQMFIERPVTGFGPGMFKDNYFEYLGKAGYTLVEDHRPMKWAHSLYFEQLAEKGLLGLFALLILIGKAIKDLAWSGGGISQSWLTKGVLSGFAAFLLAGVAEASLLRIWTVTLLFALTAMAYKIKTGCYL